MQRWRRASILIIYRAVLFLFEASVIGERYVAMCGAAMWRERQRGTIEDPPGVVALAAKRFAGTSGQPIPWGPAFQLAERPGYARKTLPASRVTEVSTLCPVQPAGTDHPLIRWPESCSLISPIWRPDRAPRTCKEGGLSDRAPVGTGTALLVPHGVDLRI
jgi:hypothetical protein